MAELTYREARTQALATAMRENDRLVVFGSLRGQDYPSSETFDEFRQRIFQPPVSETAYIGAAAGLGLTGWRAYCDVATASFMFTAFDQVVNEAPNFRYMSGGKVSVPMVMRILAGVRGGGGSQHSQSPERWLMSVPGLKVFKPSTPYDLKGLLLTAMNDPNPVIFVDHVRLGSVRGEVPDEAYRVPLGQADIKREGKDLSIVAAGLMVHVALDAARALESEGIDAEVLDVRSLRPLDRPTVIRSATKTGRVLVVDESPPVAGLASEIGAIVAEEWLSAVKAPFRRVCMPDVPVPYSAPLEQSLVPSAERVADEARALMNGLSGGADLASPSGRGRPPARRAKDG